MRSGGRGPEDPRAQGVSLLWVVTVSDIATIFTEIATVTDDLWPGSWVLFWWRAVSTCYGGCLLHILW